MLTMLPVSERATIMRQIAVIKINEVFQLLANFEPSNELLWAEMSLKTASQWIDSVIIGDKWKLKNAQVPPDKAKVSKPEPKKSKRKKRNESSK